MTTAIGAMRSISKIKPSLRNARTHSAKQIRQIANSIVAFGFTNPLLVSEDDELIAGHGRYEAAKLLGLAEVPVIVVTGLSRVRRRALGIADNKIAQNSRWDRERLAIAIPELADSLPAEGLDISIIGFETVEIDHIVQTDFEEHPAAPQDRIDSEWCKSLAVSKRGDLWQLGNHRLLCGDAHSIPDIARLMASCQADVAFIDPPANEQTPVDFVNLISATFSAVTSVLREGAVHYVCADWRRFAELLVAAKPIYGEPIDLVVWVKSKMGVGAFYGSQHQLIGVFRVGNIQHRNIEQAPLKQSRSNVWRYPEVTAVGVDAATKPVALIVDAIKDCTKKGNIVLDTFSRLGTTIIAAERSGRHARALEADPRFVDLAIRRWQALTHKHARHAESGLNFNQIAADHSAYGLAIR